VDKMWEREEASSPKAKEILRQINNVLRHFHRYKRHSLIFKIYILADLWIQNLILPCTQQQGMVGKYC
jgi:hypothetical protein